jgi:flagellar motor protein MotB
MGWTGTLLLAAGAIGATGCQNKLQDDNLALRRQNRELQAKLSDSDAKLRSAPDPNQLSQMQQELAARDQKIAELESQLRQPAPGQPSSSAGDPNSLAGIEVVKDDRAGTVTVRVPGDVLFDSGKATLKDSARSTLNKIAAALKKDYASKKVVVVGHTDSDPIAKTKGIWDDNLDLSAARARTVAKYLSDQGVSQKLLGMQAKADTEPRTNKSQSRRVEIVVSAN